MPRSRPCGGNEVPGQRRDPVRWQRHGRRGWHARCGTPALGSRLPSRRAHPSVRRAVQRRHVGLVHGSGHGRGSANVWYRIHLTATDSQGPTAEVTRDVTPLNVGRDSGDRAGRAGPDGRRVPVTTLGRSQGLRQFSSFHGRRRLGTDKFQCFRKGIANRQAAGFRSYRCCLR